MIMANIFNDFASPSVMSIPLIIMAIMIPWDTLPTPTLKWLQARLLLAQNRSFKTFLKQIFLPLGTEGYKWATLLTSLFAFLATLNLLGGLPYTFTPGAQLSLSLVLASPLWLATVLIGATKQPNKSIAHLLPESTPKYLIPLIILIETISLMVRPVSLAVRLAANLTAGHLMIYMLSTATLYMLYSFHFALPMVLAVLIALAILELAVALIQAYVFVLLLSLYLKENIKTP
uniref:ATP synthase subunit a n=1 Tax=Neobythites unimaculatus TaxID=1188027 RepID=A0A7I6N8Y0_9TELE|nr:ATPase subunits 6 [Neobythites unimaculatus]